jgi:hypothetical protein
MIAAWGTGKMLNVEKWFQARLGKQQGEGGAGTDRAEQGEGPRVGRVTQGSLVRAAHTST